MLHIILIWSKEQQAIFSTGSNRYGQLGQSKNPSESPQVSSFTALSNIEGFTDGIHKVHLGLNTAFATNTKGVLFAWGDNEYGQLGLDEALVQANSPEAVSWFEDNGLQVRYAIGGFAHTLVLCTNNMVYSMGDNMSGSLARYGDYNSPTIAQIDTSAFTTGEYVTSMQVAGFTNILLTNLGNVYVSGSCETGLCGEDHALDENLTISTLQKNGLNITDIWAQYQELFMQDIQGRVWVMGINQFGELCVPASPGAPVRVPQMISIANITHAHSGYMHTVILKDGVVYGCGSGQNGQFGAINQKSASLIVISDGLGTAISAAATYFGTYILTSSGLFSSGQESSGELSFGMTNGTHGYIQRQFLKVVSAEQMEDVTDVTAFYFTSFTYASEEIKNKLSGGAIAGIVVGSVLGAAAVAVGVVVLVRWLRQKPRYQYITEEKNKLVANDDQW